MCRCSELNVAGFVRLQRLVGHAIVISDGMVTNPSVQ
jgi:hypothetical protein